MPASEPSGPTVPRPVSVLAAPVTEQGWSIEKARVGHVMNGQAHRFLRSERGFGLQTVLNDNPWTTYTADLDSWCQFLAARCLC